MDIKITQNIFESKKFVGINSDFEDLDIDKDGSITEKDAEATTSATLKNDLQKIFAQINQDSDDDIDVNFNDGEIDKLDKLSDTAKDLLLTATQNATNVQETAGAGKEIGGINIEGYVDVDISNLEGKTEEELQDMLDKVINNITLLNEKITELEQQNETLKATNRGYDNEIKKLNESNDTQNAEIAKIDAKITTARNDKTNKENTVRQEEDKLETYTTRFQDVQKRLDEANERIIQEQNLEEKTYEEEMERTTEKAINDYDPAIHGDNFEVYFLKCLSTAGYIMFSKLPTLNEAAATIGDEAKSVLNDIQLQAAVVYKARANVKAVDDLIESLESQKAPFQSIIEDNNLKIKDFEDKKTANETQIASNETAIGELEKALTENSTKKTTLEAEIKKTKYNAKDILAKVSDVEKKLAKDNNVDLTKCFIAQGKKDGKWHIYLNDGTSVVRKYAKGQGFDIIKSGNGYVRNLKESCSSEKGTSEIYRLSEVNEDMTDGIADTSYAKYTTCSPLSFDVNGDGVKTSETKISYDIDGDGKLDTINDSADWVLAFDKDGNGIAGENGSELFGNNTDLDGDGVKDGYANGFDALKALAKQEGLIGDDDNILDEKDIKALSEKYGLVMTKGYGGEAKSLSELGITQINLAQTNDTTLNKNFDGRHNDIMTQEGATFVVNGETREYADIWNAKFDEPVDDKKPFGKLTTNKEGAELVQNKDGIIVMKGQVDFEGIREKAKFNPYARNIGKLKVEQYKKELEAEEQKKLDAEEAQKQEEAKKEEAKIQEQKELDEKEKQKKLDKQKNN